jgi:hypothetical protein
MLGNASYNLYKRPTAKQPTTSEEVEGLAHPLVRRYPAMRKRALYPGRSRVCEKPLG